MKAKFEPSEELKSFVLANHGTKRITVMAHEKKISIHNIRTILADNGLVRLNKDRRDKIKDWEGADGFFKEDNYKFDI